MKIQAVFALMVTGSACLSFSAWAADSIKIQVAKHNAQYQLREYYSEKTGNTLTDKNSVSELVAEQNSGSSETLPAVFEVTIYSKNEDGSKGQVLIRAEMSCKEGRTIQYSRFDKATEIPCEMTRVL
jgi:hypothetical protein